MDPLQILEKVNSFYSNAFSQLMTFTIAILGFGAVILPIIQQIIQSRSFRAGRKTLETQIADGVRNAKNDLKSELAKHVQEESKQLREYLKAEIQTMNTKLDEQISTAKAGTFYLQGTNRLEKRDYALAAINYAIAAKFLLDGKDDMNGQRALNILVKDCIPELDGSSFDKTSDLDEKLDDLIKTLESRNENYRFTDIITSIATGLKNAKKRTQQSVEPT